jgi:SOS-response transcriptional repressor LexA
MKPGLRLISRRARSVRYSADHDGAHERQGPYLAFIYSYTRLYGRPPAEAHIQRHFKVTPPTVHQMVVTLERRGSIERIPGKARSIRGLVPVAELPPLE